DMAIADGGLIPGSSWPYGSVASVICSTSLISFIGKSPLDLLVGDTHHSIDFRRIDQRCTQSLFNLLGGWCHEVLDFFPFAFFNHSQQVVAVDFLAGHVRM